MKIELTKKEISNLISAASQMECDYLEYCRSISSYNKAKSDDLAYKSALDKLRSALKK